MNNRPIFIGGLMKSGTSLLRSLIGNHSRIFGGLETWWFSDDFKTEYKIKNSKISEKIKFLYKITNERYASLLQNSYNHLDFLNKFLLYCANCEQKSRWVEKTPDNIFYLDDLDAFWGKEYYFIYMLRNPLDIFASWKINTQHDFNFFKKKIGQTVRILENSKFTASKNYHLFTYEDLVQNPTITMKRAIELIGENWEKDIEINQKDKSEFELVKKLTNKKSTTLESLSKPIFRTSIDQYHHILKTDEIQAVNEISQIYQEILHTSKL